MNEERMIGQEDGVLTALLRGGEARVLLACTTAMAQEAANIHAASDTAADAMGRLITAAAMLGMMEKDENCHITVSMRGGGPGGAMVAVTQHGRVKITMENPGVEPPPVQGKHDVEGLIGHEGRLSVVKDMGLREPYTGQVALKSGGVAEDVAEYLLESEQIPSLLALGSLVKDGAVLSSGGILIAAMPGCTEDTLRMLEVRAMLFSGISRELLRGTREELLAQWFDGLDPLIIDRAPLSLKCDCSRERMERALITLGEKDLKEIADDQKGAELSCHFCRSRYVFTPEEINALYARATRRDAR